MEIGTTGTCQTFILNYVNYRKKFQTTFRQPFLHIMTLLAGNILFDKMNDKVYLIDFEYGGTNYRGFDIANHWNEWAGGTQAEMNGVCEYQRFPADLAQMKFCKAYLNEQNKVTDTSDNEAKALVNEANKFVLLNHWFWGLWAINQAVLEGVDSFDYITYAESRAKEYFRQRSFC